MAMTQLFVEVFLFNFAFQHTRLRCLRIFGKPVYFCVGGLNFGNLRFQLALHFSRRRSMGRFVSFKLFCRLFKCLLFFNHGKMSFLNAAMLALQCLALKAQFFSLLLSVRVCCRGSFLNFRQQASTFFSRSCCGFCQFGFRGGHFFVELLLSLLKQRQLLLQHFRTSIQLAFQVLNASFSGFQRFGRFYVRPVFSSGRFNRA